MRSRRLLALPAVAAALGGASVGWTLLRRHDQRAVAADPEHAELSRPRQGRETTVTSADGTRLHAEVFGPEDAPTIVLAHGWMCDLRFWHYQIGDLARDHRVVAYDQRGHGRSQPSEAADYSTAALAADLDAVLRQCVPDGDRALLVGHSMGAMAAVAWAGEHAGDVRARLAGAVLLNTGVASLVREARVVVTAAVLGGFKQVVGRRILGLALAAPRGPTPVVSRGLRHLSMGPRATPAQVAFCEELLIACPADVRAAFGATLAGLDLVHDLHSLDVPTVVIVGEHDRLTPPVHGRRIAQTLPQAELVTLHDAGHMSPIEVHDEVTAHVRSLAARTLAAQT